MKKVKKINLSSKELDSNISSINQLLTKKGMSAIVGGAYDDKNEWGNSNYAESTYVRK